MDRFTIVGHLAEKDRLMSLFVKCGNVEIRRTAEIDNTVVNLDVDYRQEVNNKLSEIDFAFAFIKDADEKIKKHEKANDIKDSVLPKKKLFTPQPSYKYDEFNAITYKEYELFDEIHALHALNDRQNEIKSQRMRTKAEIASLSSYKNFPLKFNRFKDTANTVFILGEISVSKLFNVEMALDAMKETKGVEHEFYPSDTSVGALAVIAHKDDKQEVLKLLSESDFSPCNYNYDRTAEEVITELNKRLEDLDKAELENAYKAVKYNGSIDYLQLLYDYYLVRLETVDAGDMTRQTATCYVMEGYVPSDEIDEVKKLVDESGLSLEFNSHHVEEDDTDVPTKLENKKLVQPFEPVTNMFSVPNYKEKDPNTIMGIFYFLFFGLMVSDAGYGVVLSIASLLAIFVMHPKKSTERLLLLLFLGGISTTFWGIMFGSWFGILGVKPVMFNTLEGQGPLYLLILSLVMGLIQIIVGLIMRAYAAFRRGKWFDAIADAFTWLFVFAGLIMIVLPMVFTMPDIIKTIGLVLVITGLVGILLTAGRKKPSIAGKIVGGFTGLYGIINFMGDLLSYARLFGLGLATGAICMVVNQMGGIIMTLLPGVFGIIVAVIVLVVGHAINLAINTLGAYVHNNRLQFVEFYSKFYVGDGREFKPLGSSVKYINLETLSFGRK